MIVSSGRDNTSVLLCCSASGQILPVLSIFEGENILETWINTYMPSDQTVYGASKKGWMMATIFLKWFEKCFLQNISQEMPVLLIFYGHVMHISLELITSAKANNIYLLKLPSHTSHLLQPLDMGVFKGIKTNWDKSLVKWQ